MQIITTTRSILLGQTKYRQVNPEEANADGELLPPPRCISKAPVCVYEDTCADAIWQWAEEL